MLMFWPRNGDTRGEGRNRQIYYHGEWQSPRGEETVFRNGRTMFRMSANPDWKAAQNAARRRRRAS